MTPLARNICFLGLSIAFASCDRATTHPANAESTLAPGSTSAATHPDAPVQRDDIEASDFLGVTHYLFKQTDINFHKAAHRGKVQLRNGCLYVGDKVVIWHRRLQFKVKDLIADVQAGQNIEIELAGSRSKSPLSIQQRCGAAYVWNSGDKLARPDWSCKDKEPGDDCVQCRQDDPDCKETNITKRCDANLNCTGSLQG